MDYLGRTRRTMGEALMTEGFSRDALAFVSGKASMATTAPAVAARAETPPRKRTPPATIRPARNRGIPAAASDTTVSMTFRLPADLPSRLIQISAERKVRREMPFSQQDIVAEALREWLATHASCA
jgi:hypothetical protein